MNFSQFTLDVEYHLFKNLCPFFPLGCFIPCADPLRDSQKILKNLATQHTVDIVLFTTIGDYLDVIRHGIGKKE